MKVGIIVVLYITVVVFGASTRKSTVASKSLGSKLGVSRDKGIKSSIGKEVHSVRDKGVIKGGYGKHYEKGSEFSFGGPTSTKSKGYESHNGKVVSSHGYGKQNSHKSHAKNADYGGYGSYEGYGVPSYGIYDGGHADLYTGGYGLDSYGLGHYYGDGLY